MNAIKITTHITINPSIILTPSLSGLLYHFVPYSFILLKLTAVSIALSISEQNNLTKLIDTQSQQSEVISRMSLNLLDLENQVRTLEQENERLNLLIEK